MSNAYGKDQEQSSFRLSRETVDADPLGNDGSVSIHVYNAFLLLVWKEIATSTLQVEDGYIEA